MRLCTVALGEFAEGTQSAEDPVLQAVAGAFELASVDRLTALEYGRLVRSLRSEGRLIGTNDLWIAACALRHDLPLVSANLKHFSRVPGLKLLSY